MKRHVAVTFCAALVALTAVTSLNLALEVKNETYALPNGLTVILHEDHRLPQVVVNILYAVGSKDEVAGRTGFAHLFEHLMFMGTARVPEGQFDALMEAGGGSNNASTSSDVTSYYSVGPSAQLPLLLWLDADRMEALGVNITQKKLDLQRDVVRNERRQSVENTPYGIAELIIPEALYPAAHPYHHSVIGSHEDLQAATLTDVKDFFATHYVPANAGLVVAGDFETSKVKPLIASLFGAVPAKSAPSPRQADPPVLDREVRRLATDNVEFPKLYLVWPAPAAFAPGAAEMELTASILGGSPSSRLEKRLVQETRLAQAVDVSMDSRTLASEFHVEIKAAPGADLERIKREALAVIEELKNQGPREAELRRVKAQYEAEFLKGAERLLARAQHLNFYRYFLGTPDSFDRDLARYKAVTAAGLKDWTGRTLGEGRLDLRILPRAEKDAGKNGESPIDSRPADYPAASFAPPATQSFKLANGIEVQALPQPGSGLFSGRLIVDGGERMVPREKAGLAPLLAALLTSGAAGKDAPQFAEAVESLGASIEADATRDALLVSVGGLAGRIEPTLELFADAVLRPNLAADDFKRESGLAQGRIASRADRPALVAAMAGRALVFGKDDYRGRAQDGYAATVGSLTLDDIKGFAPRLLDAGRARFVFVGDFDVDTLRRALEARFGSWTASSTPAAARPAPLTRTTAGRFVLIDRPGAPQTVIYALRPIDGVDDLGRAQRDCVNTIFGGAFTSRLNQNLREKHGYTYGAGTSVSDDAGQHMFSARTSVQTAVTGAALGEMKTEFARLAGGDITPDEWVKAVRTERQDIVEGVQSTDSLAGIFAGFIADGRPPDSLKRQMRALEQITVGQGNAQARSGIFDWNQLVIVLVGDKKEIAPQLQKAGFPAPVAADTEGNLL